MSGPTLSSSCRHGMTMVAPCVFTPELPFGDLQPHDGVARQCAAAAVVVLDGDAVLAFAQGGVEGVGGGRMIGPAVDDECAVDAHAHAVVAGGGDAVGAGG